MLLPELRRLDPVSKIAALHRTSRFPQGRQTPGTVANSPKVVSYWDAERGLVLDIPVGSTPLEGRLSDLLARQSVGSLRDRLTLARQIGLEIHRLHESSTLHRGICAESIQIDAKMQPRLSPPPDTASFGGNACDPEFCPPELFGSTTVALPSGMALAEDALRQSGYDLDPRRIDVYQLGVTLCRLLTGESIFAYRYRPATKARVPAVARALLARLLGEPVSDHDCPDQGATQPITDCDEALRALKGIIDRSESAVSPEWMQETPGHGMAVGPASETPHTSPRVGTAAAPSSLGESQPPTQLGHFKVLERIGHGGMGDVYRGYDESLDRHVAIKVLRAELGRDANFVRRFQAEASTVARINHPNVVPIHAVGQDAGCHYFVMSLIDGEALSRRLAGGNRLRADDSLDIVEQCLEGLSAAHAQGLVHRDIKPGNVLLERTTGRVLVVDFGLVRRLGSGDSPTASGVVLGTVDYIAPEQAHGGGIDGRADIYAVGVMLYQMLAGRLPFQAETPTAMIFQHAYEDPTPLEEAANEVPPALAAVVARMMAKDPAQRYPTCQAALADLRIVRAGGMPAVATLAPAGTDQGTITGLPSDAELAECEEQCRQLSALRQQQREALLAIEAELTAATTSPTQASQASDGIQESGCRASLAELQIEADERRRQLADIEERLAKAEAALEALRKRRRGSRTPRFQRPDGKLLGYRGCRRIASTLIALLLAAGTLVTLKVVLNRQSLLPPRPKLLADRIRTEANDFVVDIYHNGEKVPRNKRHLVVETFGATGEEIDASIREGDWIVFNVVNNRFRWDGLHYFAAIGLLDRRTLGFSSDVNSGEWSSCDDPSDVPRFIADRDYLAATPVQLCDISSGGTPEPMTDMAAEWEVEPIWGQSRNTWIKFVPGRKKTPEIQTTATEQPTALPPTDAKVPEVQPPASTLPIVARAIHTVTQHFVVEVYHNGRRVDDRHRQMTNDIYGAAAEKIDLDVRKGDWVVFNVANNRLRGENSAYFAAQGMTDDSTVGFTTERSTGQWSCCDDPAEVRRFIAERDHLATNAPEAVENSWEAGEENLRSLVSDWQGQPIWGTSKNTWIKFIAR